MNKHNTITVAMTGASGAQYGLRLIDCLLKAGKPVYLLISKAAHIVINTETSLQLPTATGQMQTYLTQFFKAAPAQLTVFHQDQWTSPLASGSSSPTQMVVCPCSMGSLSAIATGASNNLIERAADVVLKERRQLIVVPRETPYSEIHLQHMLTLTRMGVIILDANPGFYHHPKTADDLVDFVVARILNHLGIEQTLIPKWGE
jgi:4-hydroxy-3-polyprenylbenzoate decarboxylase